MGAQFSPQEGRVDQGLKDRGGLSGEAGGEGGRGREAGELAPEWAEGL